MSTGSTGSTFPKWQLAVLLGAPVALGIGYLCWRNSSDLTDDDKKLTKKKLGDIKDKTISLDGDDKGSRQDDTATKKTLTPLQVAQQHKNDGNGMFKKGKFDEAIKHYDLAIEKCPSTATMDLSTFYQNRAAAYEHLRKYDAVVDDCTKAIELNPTYIKALHRRAKAYEQRKELENCLEDTTATCILEQFQNKSTLILADHVLKQLGREHAQEAMKNKKVVYPSKNAVRNYFQTFSNDPVMKMKLSSTEPKGFIRAKMLLDEEKFEEIIPACTEEIESSESESEYKMEATLLRATFRMLTGSFAEAAIDLESVINNTDNDVKLRTNALIKRASINMQTEKPEECFADFQLAVELDPKNSDIYHQRGQVYTLLERLDDAYMDFKTASSLAPESGLTFVHQCYAEYRLALQNQDQMKLFQAMAQFQQAIAKYPNCFECYSSMGQVLCEQQQFQEADSYFEKAIKIDPANAQIHVHRGLLQLQSKADIPAAITLIKKAIQIDNKCEFAYETLGTIEVQRGNLDEAITLFNEAIKLVKSEMELVHLYSLKYAAQAQKNVSKKMGIQLESLSMMSSG